MNEKDLNKQKSFEEATLELSDETLDDVTGGALNITCPERGESGISARLKTGSWKKQG